MTPFLEILRYTFANANENTYKTQHIQNLVTRLFKRILLVVFNRYCVYGKHGVKPCGKTLYENFVKLFNDLHVFAELKTPGGNLGFS